MNEKIRKLLNMSNDAVIEIGQQNLEDHKLWVSLEPGGVAEEECISYTFGTGNTFEEALDDYIERLKGKSFMFAPDDKEPYEVKCPF